MSPALALRSPGQPAGTIEPALDYALSVYPPEIARHAAPPIRRMLGDPFAWTGHPTVHSRLTGDGFPFELSFSTADPGRLRFTLEPWGTGRDGSPVEPGMRLRFVREELGAGGEGPGSGDLWDLLSGLQRGGALTYGAWVGARVDGEGASFKVYVEVPEGARMPAICPAGPVLPGRFVVPRMVGYTPATGAVESYFRIPSLEPEHLVAVLAPAGIAARAGAVMELVEQVYGYRVRGRLPGSSVGVSYTADAAGRRVTLYFFARSLWGSDARIRRTFAQLAGECGWSAAPYLEVTEPIASRENWKTRHGLVGFTLRESRESIPVSIGVRPVAPG